MHNLRLEEESRPSHAASAGTLQSHSTAGQIACSNAEQTEWMRTALHDLAQPLTALECVLFLGTLEPEADGQRMRQAIDQALAQCSRLTQGVRAMQDRLHAGG